MANDTQAQSSLQPHVIWQDGIHPEPCIVVIFGATGDLTRRKLLPTLAHLMHAHPQPQGFVVVAFARRPFTQEQWRQLVVQALAENSPPELGLDEEARQSFAQRTFYCQANLNESAGYQKLAQLLEQLDQQYQTRGNRIFYLAIPPDLYAPVVHMLGENGLVHRPHGGHRANHHGPWSRVIIEKPFGRDLPSAQKLNREIARILHEDQIYRIDHYMGKETVQNILAMRFSNGIFEPLWNQKYIDHVQILVAEDIGIGGRAEYYDEAGAIRDMVQNHIFQVLCLTAMEPPVAFEADAIRDEKVKLLRAIPPLTPEEVAHQVVRGQYTRGTINGQEVPGYREEDGIPADSSTETFVALKLFIENWRWADVPFYIRTGKRLPKRSTEVTIQFKRVPHLLYKPSEARELIPNRLTVRIQPEEGITLKFGAKVPGAAQRLKSVDMTFSYATAFQTEPPDAYERLIADCMLGDSTLFIRRDEIETAWRIIDSITTAWQQMPADNVRPYAAGTWGPAEAEELIRRDGREWDTP
ncbi:glucose-6-phosphate dehydrogenase [Thermogemmatispora tikiterensis]|uniref:Glucose-6-phosphate 1-dehydrogenase n=1 Tax=Thermogemmatispora tikiterensis TaxID=1825093 RepID=A0A328VGQ2_9CHLR|nr:glucose-6-phosphate dehydrogenase [Thermogemmatispora tikiterensis]RAQ94920.1 glucose-6-phosphate dehydrogenase [Thermogemmatispora tikiterensis]